MSKKIQQEQFREPKFGEEPEHQNEYQNHKNNERNYKRSCATQQKKTTQFDYKRKNTVF